MTREEKENLLREAVDILIKLDNHLMTSMDNAEFSSWVEDLIDNNRLQEQNTGHWIFEEGDGKTCFDGYVCSACNKSFHTHVPYFAEYEFCPHCGADMRESEEQA